MRIPVLGGVSSVFAEDSGSSIVLDHDNVYWIRPTRDGEDGAIVKLAKNSPGGTPSGLASNLLNPKSLVVDGTLLYWIDEANDAAQSPIVYSVSINGGAKTMVVANTPAVNCVATDPLNVYWCANNALMRVAKGGYDETSAVSNSVQAVVVSNDNLFWIQGSAIMKAPTAGGTITQVASVPDAYYIYADKISIYWLSSQGVYRLAQ